MNKLLFITFYLPPHSSAGVQRASKFIKYLPVFSWKPVVVSSKGIKKGNTDRSLMADIKDTQVHRMDTYSLFNISNDIKNSFLKKTINLINKFFIPDPFYPWYFFNRKKVLRIMKNEKINTLITTSYPYSTHLLGLYIKKNIKKTGWIADFRDEWATNPVKNEIKELPLLNFIKNCLDYHLEKKVITNADKILLTTPAARDYYQHRYKNKNKFIFIPNGFDETDFKKIKKKKNKKFSIVYYGSTYGSRNPGLFLSAFASFLESLNPKDKKNIVVKFIGRLDRSDEIKDFCRKNNIENSVIFIDHLEHDKLLKEAASSSLLLYY